MCPLTTFSQMLTSYVSVVQYQNEEININTMLLTRLYFFIFHQSLHALIYLCTCVHTHVCACVSLWVVGYNLMHGLLFKCNL